MAQTFGNNLELNSLLKSQAGPRVPQVMKSDSRQSSRLDCPLKETADRIRMQG